MFEVAGSYGTILLGLGGAGALFAVVLAVISILGKRIPLVAWLLMPAIITLIGAYGSFSATGQIGGLLGAEGDIGSLSSSGLAAAFGARWLGHWVVAALSAFSIWCVAISVVVKPGGETRGTPFVAIMAFLFAALSPIGTVAFAIHTGLGSQALLLIGLVSVAGVGCAAVAFRRALHEAAYRVAALRFAAGLLMVFTAGHGVRALTLHGHMERLLVRATSGPDEIAELMATALTMQDSIGTLAILVFGVGLGIALFTFLGEAGEVIDKFALFDIAAVMLLLGGVGGFRYMERNVEILATGTANMYPLGELVTQYGFQLPVAAVGGFTETFDLRLGEAPFGDIIVFGTRPSYVQPPLAEQVEGQPAPVPPAKPLEWYRAFVWSGNTWVPDDTPLAELQPTEGLLPLIAGPGATSSEALLTLLNTFGGSAQILMRSGEIDKQIVPELAYTEAHWMTLSLTEGIDYESESFAQTERYDPYVGVSRYIGTQRRNDKPVHRMDKMIADSEFTAIRATVGERVRLDHIISLCLSTQVVPGLEPELDDVEEAPTAREDFECTLVDMTIDEAIEGAVAALGLPESENVRMTIEIEEGIDLASDQPILRELEAFGACAGQVQEDMGMEDTITGRLAASFTIDNRGRAGRFEFETERRDIEIFDMKLCVRERLEWARFPEYIAPERPEPELDEEGNEIEVEVIPTPRVSFVLTYR